MKTKLLVGVSLVIFFLLIANILAIGLFGTPANNKQLNNTQMIAIVNKTDSLQTNITQETNKTTTSANTAQQSDQSQSSASSQTQTQVATLPPVTTIQTTPMPRRTRAS